MAVEARLLPERLAAVVALVGLVARVSEHVALEHRHVRRERLAANGALIAPIGVRVLILVLVLVRIRNLMDHNA